MDIYFLLFTLNWKYYISLTSKTKKQKQKELRRIFFVLSSLRSLHQLNHNNVGIYYKQFHFKEKKQFNLGKF